MRKIVIITTLSLLYFYCGAQSVHGVSIGYAPWGVERLTTWNDNKSYRGNHTFIRPAIKLDFEFRHGGASIQQLGLVYSTTYADLTYTDSLLIPYHYQGNFRQIGMYYRPGWTIMPRRRVQIPILFSFGLNYCFGDLLLRNTLMTEIGLIAQLKIYITNWMAIYGGFTVQGGISRVGVNSRMYSDFGLLFNF